MKKHRFFDIFCHGEQQPFCHCGPRAAIGFRTKPGMTIKTTLWRTKPAMTKVLVLLSLIITIPAFATDPDPAAQKTVASKAYVDTKQDIIETGLVEFNGNPEFMLPAITTYDSTSGLVSNKIGILDQETIADDDGGLLMYHDDNYENGEMDNFVPTVRAVANALRNIEDSMPDGWTALTWDSAETTSTNAYETKFVGDTGATAQSWPAIDKDKLVDGSALANALALKQNRLPARFTSETNTTQMRAMGGETIELAGGAGYVYHRYITAGGNEPLTIRSGADNTILYVNGTKTVEQFQTSNFGGTGNTATTNQNYIKNALVSLELLKDVYSELDSKITNNALPTGTTGTVVTYNGTNATTGVQEFTETAMTGAVTYTNGTLDNANDIATITAVGTRQKKKECGGYEPAAAGQPAHDGTHPGDEDYCWLWIFPDD